MIDNNNYEKYSIEDWIEDENFARWLKEPDSNETGRLFTELMQQNAEVSGKMKIAAEIITGINVQEPSLAQEEVELMWNTIREATVTPRRLRFGKYRNYWGAAAVVALLIGFGWLYSLPDNNLTELQDVASVVSVDSVEDITLFVANQPRLQLSDKVKLKLSDETMELNTRNGDKIAINNLSFSDKEYASLVVPRGRKASVLFADGSRITIRPGTKISFPTAFNGSLRHVFVEGEAFFEVAKNKKVPFIVSTPQMNVRVLGTTFDVNSYPENKTNSVVLVTGRVKAGPDNSSEVEITPNQMYSYNKQDNTSKVDQVDVYNYISWKDGILSFNSESLTTVLGQLGNYFGVDFDYETIKLRDIKITGKLDLNHDLDSALKVLSEISNTKFSTMNAKIKVDVKP